jgi:alcohol dehydrogenase (cytochrome c)
MKLIAILSLLALPVLAQDAGKHPGKDWPSYGGSFGNERFSKLRQVTARNVQRLEVKWTFAVPDAGQADNSLQTTPLVVRGRRAGLPRFDAVLFVTTPMNRVLALDGATGRLLWDFSPPLREPLKVCCSRANRGAAFGRLSPGGPRVYVATLDGRLWAVSASTGVPIPKFGDHIGPPGSVTVADHSAGFSLTAAPLFIPKRDIPTVKGDDARDLVVIGTSGGEFGTRGFLTAYDANTGEIVWRFFTIPEPDDFGGDTWPTLSGDFADPFLRGGGAVWMTPAYDRARGWLFLAVGNPHPNLDGTHRAGDNLFTASIVALDIRTGERIWHFQQVHHDLWDYDPASPPLLFDVGGRPAVGEAGKTGMFYILDRETGEPIFPCLETAVPGSNVVALDGTPEVASPTQPLCGPGLQFVPFLQPGEPPRPLPWGSLLEPIFTPPSPTGGSVVEPAFYGGSEWSPVAYHPALGLAFISAVTLPADFIAFPTEKPITGEFWLGGLPIPQLFDLGGTFTAIDVRTGTRRWQRRTPWLLVGGSLSTAGGLVFYGEGNLFGGAFIALDAATGAERFRFPTQGGVNAAPMTFLAEGRQLVTVAAGGHPHYLSRQDNRLITFGLPE